MTRPIYEPTDAREDARLSYGSDQLFRRPSPRGAGTEWGIALWTTDQDVPTGFGSAINPAFDEAYIPSGQTAIVINPNFSTQPHQPFLLVAEGIYSVNSRVAWNDTNWSDNRMLQILSNTGVWLPTPIDERKGGGSGQGTAMFVTCAALYVDPQGGDPTPYLEMSQTSGSTKVAGGGGFSIAYHGTSSEQFDEITPVTP